MFKLAGLAVALLRAPVSPANDFGIESHDLWDGLDVDLAPTANATFASISKAAKHVHVIGLFNSGTNLLTKLLPKNFGDTVSSANDVGFWKHSSIARLAAENPDFAATMAAKGAVAVAVTRQPLSWLQSMRKSPYDLTQCVHGWRSYLTSSCTLPAPCHRYSTHCGHAVAFAHGGIHIDNLGAFWNQWTREYGALARYGFQKALLVRYEDLVLDTEGVLARLAEMLALPAPRTVVQQHRSAKAHGRSSGRAAALAKLRTRSYLQLYAAGERERACSKLDAGLLAAHDYATDCA